MVLLDFNFLFRRRRERCREFFFFSGELLLEFKLELVGLCLVRFIFFSCFSISRVRELKDRKSCDVTGFEDLFCLEF